MDVESVQLRAAGAEDMELLYALHKEGMRPHVERLWGAWDEDAQRERFYEKTDPATHEVIELAGEPVGCMWVRPHADTLELVRIFLLTSAQGRGIGTYLIRRLLAEAHRSGKAVRLRVLKGNPARRLYERLGFVVTKRTETHDYMRAPVQPH